MLLYIIATTEVISMVLDVECYE
jgi:hypothetical protein